MKAKVIIDFIDKNTHKLHKAGETLDVSPERFAEINKMLKRVEVVPEASQKAKENEETKK